MRKPLLRINHPDTGQAPSAEYAAMIHEARRAVTDDIDERIRQWMLENIDYISTGKTSLLTLQCDEHAAGFLSYHVMEDDVQIHFCYVTKPYHSYEGWFFKAAVNVFRDQGLKIIRTSFHWPCPERCIDASRELGFIELQGISMLRENDAGYPEKPLAEGVEIRLWSDDYLGEAGHLLFTEANPIDRQIYPQLESLEGTVEQLSKITCNFYGNFLPAQSMVVVYEGKVIGLMLATEFENDLVLIAEIAVEKSYRGRGIASAMLGRIIRCSAELGKKQLEVVVNAQNREAIALYERKGFQSSVIFKQNILVFR